MAFDDEKIVSVRADTAEVERSLEHLERLSRGFGRSLSSALEGAALRGRSLSDVLRGLGSRLVELSLRSAMRPLESMIGGMFGNALSGAMPFAKGGVPGRVQPFAAGGIVSTPTYFPMGRNLGVMGESGTEAVLPLARGSDGRLGVRAGKSGSAVNVTVNIQTPDVDGFRRSEAQVSASLARAVARGRRGL